MKIWFEFQSNNIYWSLIEFSNSKKVMDLYYCSQNIDYLYLTCGWNAILWDLIIDITYNEN